MTRTSRIQKVVALMTCAVLFTATMVHGATPRSAEPGDVGIQAMSLQTAPAASADKEQGDAPLFVGCPTVVLAGNGSTSQNGRAPSRNFRFARSVYLITQAELASTGLLNGAVPGSIGWRYSVAPSAATAGNLVIYLENTTDTANTKSATWTTAISSMTMVSTGGVNLPVSTSFFDIPFTGGSPFTYTGGGIYVAFDWSWAGPGAVSATVACTNVLAGGLMGNQDNTAPPATLLSSAFRPETRLTPSIGSANDAAVDLVYSLGSIPQTLVGPQVFQAVVSNRGTAALTNVPVTVNVTGAQVFSDVQNVASLAACGGTSTVTFAGMTPTAVGSDTVTVSVPADGNNANNSKANPLNVTNAVISYKYPGSLLSGGVGNTAVIQLGTRFNVTALTQVDTVQLEFASAAASSYKVAIYGDAGGLPGALLYEDAFDRIPVAGPVSIRLPAPVPVGPGNFYVVAEQTSATNYSLSFDTETPLRVGSFFFTPSIPAGVWADFAPANTFKINLGAVLGACIAPPVVSVTPDPASVCQGGTLTFTCNVSGAAGNTNIQWTENGVDIGGATNPTLLVTKAGAGSFTYNCKVTDDAACTNIVDATPATGTWIANGGACEDGNACTGPDACGAGICQPGPNPCNDNDACTNDLCGALTGCTYTPVNCNDSNVCTADSCNSGSGCINAPVAGPCTDGNVCTVGDACSAGVCVAGPVPTPVQFCNNNPITIGAGTASPYPSSVSASGLNTILCKATVNLSGLSHSWPQDIDMLLAGPSTNATIVSDTGGTNPGIAGVNLLLDDAAAISIPDAGFGSGTYKPTNLAPVIDTFALPAPTPLGGAALSVFNGTNPNGTWSLYIVDDSAGDTGSLSGGWCVNIIAAPCTTIADCNDSNACTSDACSSGICSHVAVNCADGDACTNDTCDTNTGLCPHGPTNCDDGDACTTDSCNSLTGCAHAQVPPSQVTNLRFGANKHSITWDAVASPPYDIIYGDLIQLHTSGITASTGGCLGDNGANPVSDDTDTPGPGQGFWYLSRSRGCGGVTGTYNEGGNQVANRDPLIPAPPIDCSRP